MIEEFPELEVKDEEVLAARKLLEKELIGKDPLPDIMDMNLQSRANGHWGQKRPTRVNTFLRNN